MSVDSFWMGDRPGSKQSVMLVFRTYPGWVGLMCEEWVVPSEMVGNTTHIELYIWLTLAALRRIGRGMAGLTAIHSQS